MPKVTEFNRQTIAMIELALKEAFLKIEGEFGIQLEPPVMRYNSTYFRAGKIEGRLQSSADSLEKVKSDIIERDGYLKVGSKFRIRETVYEIVEVNIRRPKNCYNVVTQNGTRYRCGKELVASSTIIYRA